jgi:hypothetical protein
MSTLWIISIHLPFFIDTFIYGRVGTLGMGWSGLLRDIIEHENREKVLACNKDESLRKCRSCLVEPLVNCNNRLYEFVAFTDEG